MHSALGPAWDRPSPVWPSMVDSNGAFPPVVVLPLEIAVQYAGVLPLALLPTVAASLLFPTAGDVRSALGPPSLGALAAFFVPVRPQQLQLP